MLLKHPDCGQLDKFGIPVKITWLTDRENPGNFGRAA